MMGLSRYHLGGEMTSQEGEGGVESVFTLPTDIRGETATNRIQEDQMTVQPWPHLELNSDLQQALEFVTKFPIKRRYNFMLCYSHPGGESARKGLKDGDKEGCFRKCISTKIEKEWGVHSDKILVKKNIFLVPLLPSIFPDQEVPNAMIQARLCLDHPSPQSSPDNADNGIRPEYRQSMSLVLVRSMTQYLESRQSLVPGLLSLYSARTQMISPQHGAARIDDRNSCFYDRPHALLVLSLYSGHAQRRSFIRALYVNALTIEVSRIRPVLMVILNYLYFKAESMMDVRKSPTTNLSNELVVLSSTAQDGEIEARISVGYEQKQNSSVERRGNHMTKHSVSSDMESNPDLHCGVKPLNSRMLSAMARQREKNNAAEKILNNQRYLSVSRDSIQSRVTYQSELHHYIRSYSGSKKGEACLMTIHSASIHTVRSFSLLLVFSRHVGVVREVHLGGATAEWGYDLLQTLNQLVSLVIMAFCVCGLYSHTGRQVKNVPPSVSKCVFDSLNYVQKSNKKVKQKNIENKFTSLSTEKNIENKFTSLSTEATSIQKEDSKNGLSLATVHPTEIRTSISPSSAVELNTTGALANYGTEAEWAPSEMEGVMLRSGQREMIERIFQLELALRRNSTIGALLMSISIVILSKVSPRQVNVIMFSAGLKRPPHLCHKAFHGAHSPSNTLLKYTLFRLCTPELSNDANKYMSSLRGQLAEHEPVVNDDNLI
uniref:(California timema) hypothetical protein n=1 Tax=Timema californicum TaxID=61474 RepID=A0A7R9IZ55_TIMCA|nr:unnamed protein product [Timema californicum]